MSNQPQAHVADERAACPFCGGEDSQVFHDTSSDHMYDWDFHVECKSCGASGECDKNEEHAINAWNTRAAIPAGANGVDDIAFNAQRLRNVAHLVGLQGAIPDSDSTLDGARGAVLGMIADRLRREMKWDSGIAAGAPAVTVAADIERARSQGRVTLTGILPEKHGIAPAETPKPFIANPEGKSADVLAALYRAFQRGDSVERVHAAVMAIVDAAQPAPTSEPGARERIDDFINRMLHAKPGTVCPMCGQNGAHDHTTAEVLIYRNGLKHGLWRQEQDRVVGQGAAQAAEDDAGATGDSGRAGTDEHNEHRAGQSIGKHGSFGQDSGSAGLSGAVPVQASAVVATPASPAVPDPKPQYKFDDAQGTVTLTNADKMPAYTAVSADPAPLVAQASPAPNNIEQLEEIQQAIAEMYHAWSSPNWFTHGASGARLHFVTWHQRVSKAVAGLIKAAPEASPLVEDAQRIVAGKVEASDTERLDWLDRQSVSYGFEDYLEGHNWEISGPYQTIRMAIDGARIEEADRATTGNATADDGKDK